jgi:hypothetical protein
MTQAKFCFGLVLCLIVATFARAVDLREAYVGKSSCVHGLQKGVGSFGIRLDKKQVARLEARTSEGRKILMIVQYQKEWDACGTVRDIIQSKAADAFFVFECVDDRNPAAVVVGTWRDQNVSGPSLQSWRVELSELKFVPIAEPVRYVPQRLSGNDDGSDLAGWARQRGAKAHQRPTK